MYNGGANHLKGMMLKTRLEATNIAIEKVQAIRNVYISILYSCAWLGGKHRHQIVLLQAVPRELPPTVRFLGRGGMRPFVHVRPNYATVVAGVFF